VSDGWEDGARILRARHQAMALAEAKYSGTVLHAVGYGHLLRIQHDLDGPEQGEQRPEGKRLADAVRDLMARRLVEGDEATGAIKLTAAGQAVGFCSTDSALN
jgi:hypothetical protein